MSGSIVRPWASLGDGTRVRRAKPSGTVIATVFQHAEGWRWLAYARGWKLNVVEAQSAADSDLIANGWVLE